MKTRKEFTRFPVKCSACNWKGFVPGQIINRVRIGYEKFMRCPECDSQLYYVKSNSNRHY